MTSSTRPRLHGAFTALVTPFRPDGALDEAAFRQLNPQGPFSPEAYATVQRALGNARSWSSFT